jgi:cytochrome c oxidase assembly protein subunit 15
MGTQVRQEVDIWMKGFKNIPDEWSTLLSVVFDFHRVMAIALFFMALFLFNKMAQNGGNPHSRNLIVLVVFEGLVGMFLSGLSLPNFIQPVHLVLSALLFGTSMRLLVSVKK